MQFFKANSKDLSCGYFFQVYMEINKCSFLKPFLELYAMTCLECSRFLKIKRLFFFLFLLASRHWETCLT